jgi:hypothetical protein
MLGRVDQWVFTGKFRYTNLERGGSEMYLMRIFLILFFRPFLGLLMLCLSSQCNFDPQT